MFAGGEEGGHMNMDVLLARILKYLNGALFYDDYYKLCTYLVNHYLEMETMTKDRILLETGIREENMDDFISRLGLSFKWEDFHKTFMEHHYTRLDQIRGRMLGLKASDMVKNMEKDVSDEEMLASLSALCGQIERHERIVLIGALYPMSIAVEFQTDLITFGKNVVQFHNYDPDMKFTDGDMLIFISATGRAMKGFLNFRGDLNPQNATSLLITQNPVYIRPEHKISDYVLRLPGRYDGVNFNYQLMQVFDLLRIQYYQQYYLGNG